MKKIIPAILVLILFSSCTHTVYKSLDWQRTKVTADGWNIEWPDELRFMDEKTRISYNITNDLYNLYVFMRVADPIIVMKIIHGGMELRIDTLGKNAFPIEFIFPMANEIVMTRDMRGISQKENNYGERPTHPAIKQKILSPATEAQLVGFKHPHEGRISLLHNTSGISASIEIDSLGMLSYEAILPFSAFYKDELTKVDTNHAFNYEFMINALPAPSDREGGGGGGQGMSGGMGGGGQHGGGQHGGAGRGGSHGDEQGGEGRNPASNAGLYVASQFAQKMKFSLK